MGMIKNVFLNGTRAKKVWKLIKNQCKCLLPNSVVPIIVISICFLKIGGFYCVHQIDLPYDYGLYSLGQLGTFEMCAVEFKKDKAREWEVQGTYPSICKAHRSSDGLVVSLPYSKGNTSLLWRN